MGGFPAGRVLVIIGSGETSPTMVELHKELIKRLGLGSGRQPRALVLATPYAFQENAADVSARSRRYFAESVGLEVRVAPGTSQRTGPEMAPPTIGADLTAAAEAQEAAAVGGADWVFAGPGSPSYALAHWRAGPVGGALRERVMGGAGLTVLASAAAAAAGRYALPVYEIYKAGGALRWLSGLDLLGAIGLPVALIPHYDNTEGRHYDTRYCYLGERRLAIMERQLPTDAAVLGVDEHTAVLIDLQAGSVEVRGRGGMTVRREGGSVVLPSGSSLPLEELQDLVGGRHGAAAAGSGSGAGGGSGGGGSGSSGGGGGGSSGGGAGGGSGGGGSGSSGGGGGGAGVLPLPEVMRAAEAEFGAAAARRDAGAMGAVIVSLEAAIGEWEADTDEDQGTEQARALLRKLVGRLALAGQDDRGDRLAPAVEALIAARNALRDQGNFAAADAIRAALAGAGFEVSDTPGGTRWEQAPPA